MKQLSVVLAAFVGVGLIVFGVFLLGREIGMEGRVTAQPEPLVQGTPVANTGEGGGGGPSATVQSEATETPDMRQQTSIAFMEYQLEVLLNPPEADEGCLRYDVDLSSGDVLIDVPFDAYAVSLPFSMTHNFGDFNYYIGFKVEESVLSTDAGNYVDFYVHRETNEILIMYGLPGYVFIEDMKRASAILPRGTYTLMLISPVRGDNINYNYYVEYEERNEHSRVYLYLCEANEDL